MIEQIGDYLKSKINTLPYVNKLAGVVKSAVRYDEITDPESGQVLARNRNVFPVACSVSGIECWNKGRYQDLMPNSTYASILYFEDLTGVNFSKVVDNMSSQYNASLRLVCWLNLKKLGIDNCASPVAIQFELIEKLKGSGLITALHGARVEVFIRRVFKTPEIFSKYSYDKAVVENMLLYPYDYFAIDLDIVLQVSNKCHTPFVPTTEIECIEL